MTLYWIRAACPNCGEVANLVEERDRPVPLMQDVEITSRCCPLCGGLVHEWDVHEESEIERVQPTQEREA